MRTSSTQSSSGSVPSISRASAEVIGALSPRCSIARASRGRSRTPRSPGRSGRGSPPTARPGPAARRRCGCATAGASAVATRSPVPARPTNVRGAAAAALGQRQHLGEDVGRGHAGGVQALRLGRAGGQRRGVLRAARQLDADRVVGRPRTRRRPGGTRRHTPGQRAWRVRRADQPGAALHHLPGVRRAADAGDALDAERALERDGRRHAVRRHQPLGQRHDARRARGRPGARAARARRQPGRRHGDEDQVGAVELVVDARRARATFSRSGSVDAREVLLVLALLVELARLLLGPAQQRGAHAGALEQDGDGGAEGAAPTTDARDAETRGAHRAGGYFRDCGLQIADCGGIAEMGLR